MKITLFSCVHVILNDKSINRILCLGSNNKFQAISLPFVSADFKNRIASLCRLLGISVTENALVELKEEYLTCVIVAAEVNPSTKSFWKQSTIATPDGIILEI